MNIPLEPVAEHWEWLAIAAANLMPNLKKVLASIHILLQHGTKGIAEIKQGAQVVADIGSQVLAEMTEAANEIEETWESE